MEAKKFMAGIVLYNPDLNRLKENIDAIYTQVDKLLLVDNHSQNLNGIMQLLSQYRNTEIILNERNNGIALALSQIMKYSIKEGYLWVLTLDQDSVCELNLIQNYANFTEKKDVGIITCVIKDRNFIEYGFEMNKDISYRYVDQCITAASFVNTEKYSKTEGFDETLFIDGVDFDLCLNMRKHGYKILQVNFVGLLQEVGNGRNVKLFSKDYVAYNHSSFRNYYMARNRIIITKKYPEYISSFKTLFQEIRSQLIIVLYEKDKWNKILNRWRGVLDGLKYRNRRL